MEEPLLYPNRNELLLKVFFGESVEPNITITHIENFRRRVKTILDKYRAAAKNTSKYLYPSLTLKAGIIYSEASIKWCDEALDMLRKSPEKMRG